MSCNHHWSQMSHVVSVFEEIWGCWLLRYYNMFVLLAGDVVLNNLFIKESALVSDIYYFDILYTSTTSLHDDVDMETISALLAFCEGNPLISALLALCEGNPLVASGFPSQRASKAELWCFLLCLPEQPTEQTFELPVIWDAMTLTHWGRDKMDAISQTTFSNTFSWMKIFESWLEFHWSLFPSV